MARERWDYFLLAMGACHRAGHKLWSRTSIDGEVADAEGRAYDAALRDVYVACDEAIGRLVRQAGAEVTVLICALHGMGENASRFDLAPIMLGRILGSAERRRTSTDRLLRPLREALPVEFRTSLKSRLPERFQDSLSRFWRPHDKHDWSRTSAFCLMGDLQALVHINLKGREREGIVEPGAEYEQRLAEIEAGLLTFVDADTGERLLKRIGRGNELYPEATHRRVQPDLILDWNDSPAYRHRAITSPKYGTIDWPEPGRPLDGRSGHHVPGGWLVAAGPHIAAASRIEGAHSHDLNATIHALLEVPRPAEMRGRPLPELC
jgi:predicted AlkP superfamily phosphohydrolase/phosphomutase